MSAFRNGFAAAAGATVFGVVLLLLSRALGRDDGEGESRTIAIGIAPAQFTLDQAAGVLAPSEAVAEGTARCSTLY